MRLRYGGYTHQTGECSVVIRKEKTLSDRGVITGFKEFWRISGMLMANSVAELTTAILAFEQAYSRSNLDLELLTDAGTPTAHRLIAAQTTGGVLIRALAYPVGDGAEYTTFRRFEIEAEADYSLNITGGQAVVSFNQVISQTGTGGPRYATIETRNGPPVRQIVSQRTPIIVTQSGSATGLQRYPTPPAPLYPRYEDVTDRQFSQSTAANKGQNRESELSIQWAYKFTIV